VPNLLKLKWPQSLVIHGFLRGAGRVERFELRSPSVLREMCSAPRQFLVLKGYGRFLKQPPDNGDFEVKKR
jgi:hypothetical protein